MSKIILAAITSLALVVLPMIGVDFGPEKTTDLIQSLGLIVTSAFIWYRRAQVGDVNFAGVKQ